MNILLNKKLEVDLVSVDSKTEYGQGSLTIDKKSALITTKSELKHEILKGLIAILKNNHIFVLIEGTLFSMSSGSFGSEYQYRFYEALYYDTNNFEDRYSKVECQILLLNNWFNRKYYEIKNSKHQTQIKIENKESFKLKCGQFDITLCYSPTINQSRSIRIDPITYLIVENDNLLERFQLQEMLNCVINFYQCFFYERFDLANLLYSNNQINVASHSYKIPFTTDIEYRDGGTIWFSFNEVKDNLQYFFENWMSNKEENIKIEELFSDAFKNPSSVNRFLSAMRILEILSKKIESIELVKKAKEWKDKIAEKQIPETNERKFSQYWILQPFVLYMDVLLRLSDQEYIDIINNRNYILIKSSKLMAS